MLDRDQPSVYLFIYFFIYCIFETYFGERTSTCSCEQVLIGRLTSAPCLQVTYRSPRLFVNQTGEHVVAPSNIDAQVHTLYSRRRPFPKIIS